MSEIIRFDKVCFSYETSETTESSPFADASVSQAGVFALKEIDFSIQEGEFVAVLGHNGSGKSTLARLIDGLLTPTDGKITVLGLDACDESNVFDIRKQVGIVFQNPDNQMVASIVEDDVAFGPENVGICREEIGQRITFALDAVGMSKFRHSTPTRLSGGQKQRIAIAGALALKPKILILDESTAMLDPLGRKEVMDVVLRLNKEEGMTVLLITHFPEEAMLADRAVVMHSGEIVLEGDPKTVLSNEAQLRKYALALPFSYQVARRLTEGGLSVADTLDENQLAAEIVEKIRKSRGTGIDLTHLKERYIPAKDGSASGTVTAKNVTHVYNPKSPFETYALNGATLSIESGEFFGIIGYTGSGKSTFVQHLNALLKLPTAEKKYREKRRKKKGAAPAETCLTVAGFDLTDKNTDFRALRKTVGMVFQYPEYQLFAETVFEDVAFGLKNFSDTPLSEKETVDAVRAALEMVGLRYDEIKHRSPFELSGGQKRRVAIAGVIVTRPQILVLDEPAAGLDPQGKQEIMALLHRLHRDWCKTVIIVSHDMDEISENCTKAAVFSGGKVLACGTPSEIFASKAGIAEMGLDMPFTAKLTQALQAQGVKISSDLSLNDFVKNTLLYANKVGAGTGATEYGPQNSVTVNTVSGQEGGGSNG